MRTTVNIDSDVYTKLVEYRDAHSLTMTTAINKIVEIGFAALQAEESESEANSNTLSRLDEIQRAIDRLAGSNQSLADAAKSLERATDDVREAKAKSALAAQASMASLLVSSVDAINIASIADKEYLVYGAFREADLRATARYFMAAGKAMAEDGKIRREVWPAFKGADKYADEECLSPADVFFEGDGMRAEEAMDTATDVAGGKNRGKKRGGR